jgi:hypothetical protein
VVCIFFVNIFDAKVVDSQAEGDRAMRVSEEARSVASPYTPMCVQVLHKACIGNDSRLWQAIHALADFNHEMVVVDQ